MKAVNILLSSEISSKNVAMAKKMLMMFYNKILNLYPTEICTMNGHSLIHLSQTVQDYGPLWAYSSFGFESMNGHYCHGTRNVLPQLINNLEFHQSVLDQKYNAESHADGVRGKVKQKN